MSYGRTNPPKLDCPECGEGLIPAHGRGLHDEDGNYVEHRDGCRCHWCDWVWFDDAAPMQCACGAVCRVHCDDDHAFATVVP